MDLQKIKDELKDMYPKMQGFIQHTLVAEMCLKWHEKQVKNCSASDAVQQSEQFSCYLEDSEQGDRYDKQCGDCAEYKGECN